MIMYVSQENVSNIVLMKRRVMYTTHPSYFKKKFHVHESVVCDP